MSKLQGHLPPIFRKKVSDPSPARRPPLSAQYQWTRKEIRKDRLFQRRLFLGTTHFKLVARRSEGGPAELLRMIFCYGNIRYESQILGNIDWKSLITKTPHGNLPVLWVDHNVYGEPNSIARHLASHLGLLGRSESERLVVEAVLAQVEEIRDSDFIQLAYEEISEQRIDDNAELLLEVMVPRNFRFWDNHIQESPGPYVTGSGISVADMAIYDFLQQHLEYLPLRQELRKYPRLEGLCERVQNHPALASHFFKVGGIKFAGSVIRGLSSTGSRSLQFLE